MRRATGGRHGGRGAPRGRGALREGVQLAWARDRDGRMTPISAIDPADRRARAPFTCPGCGDELVPHLGKVRARHFAHRPGSTCPLTAPETALHFNAKERLLALCADAFARRTRVTLLTRCPGCRRVAPRDLGAAGDEARPEGAIGALRADVLVLATGRPALALEVRVTHAVDEEKESALAVAGVPAVEIDAREEWERAEEDGIAIVCHRTLGAPPCPACTTHARAEEDRALGGEAAELAELEAYRARGLFGPSTAPGAVRGDPEAAFSPAERTDLARRFRCPECGRSELTVGPRIARHPCPGKGTRPVAWRGYDGAIVELAWWRRG